MKNLALIFTLLFVSFNSIADDNHKIVTDQNGNIFVFAKFSGTIEFPSGVTIGDYNNTTERCYLAKYDSMGNCLWARDLEGSLTNYSTSLEAPIAPGIGLTLDNSGNIYITASFNNTVVLDDFISLTSGVSSRAFIAKYTTDGLVVWAKQIEGSNVGVSIESDDFGHIYAVGMFLDSLVEGGQNWLDGIHGEHEVYVYKMDTNGTSIWINSIASTSNGIHVNNLAIADDQTVYVIGKNGGSGQIVSDGQMENSYQGFYLVKFSSSGTTQWVKTFNNAGPYYYGFDRITTNSQNELIVEGQFSNQIDFSGSSNPLSTSNNSRNPFVVKFDSNGEAIWSLISNPSDTGESGFGNDLEVDAADNIWFSAMTSKFEYAPLLAQTYTFDHESWHIVKLDNAGNGLCQITPGSNDFRPVDIALDQLGNVYFMNESIGTDGDLVIGKIDNNCTLIWTSTAQMSVYTDPIGIDEIGLTSTISVFPNPATDGVNVNFGNDLVSGRMRILNVLGEMVFQSDFEEKKSAVIRSEMIPAGTYYLEVEIGESQIERVKFIQLNNPQ